MNWFNSLSGSRAKAKELEAANETLVKEHAAAVAALDAERESNTSALAALKAEIAALTEANASRDKELAEAAASVAAVKADAEKAVADFNAKVAVAAAKKAQDINAALGVPQAPQSPAGGNATNTMSRTEFNALSTSAKAQFISGGGRLKQ